VKSEEWRSSAKSLITTAFFETDPAFFRQAFQDECNALSQQLQLRDIVRTATSKLLVQGVPQSAIRRSIRLSTFFITHPGLGVRRNEVFDE